MPFKINISEPTGKTYKLELDTEKLIEKELHSKIPGKDILPDLDGYELEITGASDNAGFTSMKEVPGIGLKKLLLGYGKAMRQRPRKEGKKKPSNPRPKGLRLRRTVRGRVISPEIVQINLKVLKQGNKKLSEVFPDQNKAKEEPAQEETRPEAKKETKTEEQKPVEQKPETPKEAEK
ncbi:MAG TPA: 30S ribosomal protein S6e [Candidatus Pacearchaeota archaeon]|nr:30S ribosomal protein S6e [Candidatus Pacearchaeota archaeon]